jgi:hypothetical protein
VVLLLDELALGCCPESDLLEHAENPTAASAARLTANVFEWTFFIPLWLLCQGGERRRLRLPQPFGAAAVMDGRQR